MSIQLAHALFNENILCDETIEDVPLECPLELRIGQPEQRLGSIQILHVRDRRPLHFKLCKFNKLLLDFLEDELLITESHGCSDLE